MYIENFLNWRGEGGVIDFQSFKIGGVGIFKREASQREVTF